MIKKIKKIKNLAVFNDFDWDKTVKDKGGNKLEFKKLNITYGRNYSGKTTLSRILRSFEKGVIDDKYKFCEFSLEHTEQGLLDSNNLSNCPYTIRVYNKDFVSENLKWLSDHEGEIKSFAVLGDKNVRIEEEIESLESLLGSEQSKKGLRFDLKTKSDELIKQSKNEKLRKDQLDDKLRKKANDEIKPNSIYSDVNYNISKIKEDIKKIDLLSYVSFTEKEIEEKKVLLKENAKDNISSLVVHKFSFDSLYEITKELVYKEIKPTKSIQELLNDSLLQEWVRNGITHHRNKKEKCAFCGSSIPSDLWDKLDAHFSKEYEELRDGIDTQVANIKTEKINILNLVKPKKLDFYSILQNKVELSTKSLNDQLKHYDLLLDELLTALEKKKNDVFNIIALSKLESNVEKIIEEYKEINQLITEHNSKSTTLNTEKTKAKNDLRLDEVAKFLSLIDYSKELVKIGKLSNEVKTIENSVATIRNDVSEKVARIKKLNDELKDERKGAEKVNEYLNHFFGSDNLKLVAVQDEGKGYRFQIKRANEIAFNLSEGECTLIAFCYFIAKLEDIDTKNKDLIIWIDDPISSLDNNHIFFVFSLIESIITKPIKVINQQNTYKYKQLFISTHNLDFLKYLKRLSMPKNDVEYFFIEKINENESVLKQMPSFLKKYTTEFNYLFHQIYKCSEENTDHECFYNFGNNLRKFLEVYLFYKYPANIESSEKLTMFFNDETSVALTTRISNELSHLEEIFDRSIRPVDIPEIKKLATYVLNRIQTTDKGQYDALLLSIR